MEILLKPITLLQVEALLLTLISALKPPNSAFINTYYGNRYDISEKTCGCFTKDGALNLHHVDTDGLFNLALGKQVAIETILAVNGTVAYVVDPSLAPVFDGYFPSGHYRHLRRGATIFKQHTNYQVQFGGYFYVHSFNVYAGHGSLDGIGMVFARLIGQSMTTKWDSEGAKQVYRMKQVCPTGTVPNTFKTWLQRRGPGWRSRFSVPYLKDVECDPTAQCPYWEMSNLAVCDYMICPPATRRNIRLADEEIASYVENYTQNEILETDNTNPRFDTGVNITYRERTRGRRISVIPIEELSSVNHSDYLSPLFINTYSRKYPKTNRNQPAYWWVWANPGRYIKITCQINGMVRYMRCRRHSNAGSTNWVRAHKGWTGTPTGYKCAGEKVDLRSSHNMDIEITRKVTPYTGLSSTQFRPYSVQLLGRTFVDVMSWKYPASLALPVEGAQCVVVVKYNDRGKEIFHDAVIPGPNSTFESYLLYDERRCNAASQDFNGSEPCLTVNINLVIGNSNQTIYRFQIYSNSYNQDGLCNTQYFKRLTVASSATAEWGPWEEYKNISGPFNDSKTREQMGKDCHKGHACEYLCVYQKSSAFMIRLPSTDKGPMYCVGQVYTQHIKIGGTIDKPLTAYLVDRDYYPWIQHDNLPLLWIPNLPTDLLTTLSAVDVDSRLHVKSIYIGDGRGLVMTLQSRHHNGVRIDYTGHKSLLLRFVDEFSIPYSGYISFEEQHPGQYDYWDSRVTSKEKLTELLGDTDPPIRHRVTRLRDVLSCHAEGLVVSPRISPNHTQNLLHDLDPIRSYGDPFDINVDFSTASRCNHENINKTTDCYLYSTLLKSRHKYPPKYRTDVRGKVRHYGVFNVLYRRCYYAPRVYNNTDSVLASLWDPNMIQVVVEVYNYREKYWSRHDVAKNLSGPGHNILSRRQTVNAWYREHFAILGTPIQIRYRSKKTYVRHDLDFRYRIREFFPEHKRIVYSKHYLTQSIIAIPDLAENAGANLSLRLTYKQRKGSIELRDSLKSEPSKKALEGESALIYTVCMNERKQRAEFTVALSAESGNFDAEQAVNLSRISSLRSRAQSITSSDGRLYINIKLIEPMEIAGLNIWTHMTHGGSLGGVRVLMSSPQATGESRQSLKLCTELTEAFSDTLVFQLRCHIPIYSSLIIINMEQNMFAKILQIAFIPPTSQLYHINNYLVKRENKNVLVYLTPEDQIKQASNRQGQTGNTPVYDTWAVGWINRSTFPYPSWRLQEADFKLPSLSTNDYKCTLLNMNRDGSIKTSHNLQYLGGDTEESDTFILTYRMLYDKTLGQEETIRRIITPGEYADVTIRVYLLSQRKFTKEIRLRPRWILNTIIPGPGFLEKDRREQLVLRNASLTTPIDWKLRIDHVSEIAHLDGFQLALHTEGFRDPPFHQYLVTSVHGLRGVAPVTGYQAFVYMNRLTSKPLTTRIAWDNPAIITAIGIQGRQFNGVDKLGNSSTKIATLYKYCTVIEVGFEPFEPFYSTIIPADTDVNPENASQSQQYHTLTLPYYSEKYYIWLYHVQDSQFGPVRVEVIYTQAIEHFGILEQLNVEAFSFSVKLRNFIDLSRWPVARVGWKLWNITQLDAAVDDLQCADPVSVCYEHHYSMNDTSLSLNESETVFEFTEACSGCIYNLVAFIEPMENSSSYYQERENGSANNLSYGTNRLKTKYEYFHEQFYFVTEPLTIITDPPPPVLSPSNDTGDSLRTVVKWSPVTEAGDTVNITGYILNQFMTTKLKCIGCNETSYTDPAYSLIWVDDPDLGSGYYSLSALSIENLVLPASIELMLWVEYNRKVNDVQNYYNWDGPNSKRYGLYIDNVTRDVAISDFVDLQQETYYDPWRKYWRQPDPEVIIDHSSQDYISLSWRNPCIYGSYFIHPRTAEVIHIRYPRRSLFLFDIPAVIPVDNREFPELGTRIHIPPPDIALPRQENVTALETTETLLRLQVEYHNATDFHVKLDAVLLQVNNGTVQRAPFNDEERRRRDTAMYPKYTVPVTFDSLIPGGRHEISVWSVAGNKTSEPFTTSLFTSPASPTDLRVLSEKAGDSINLRLTWYPPIISANYDLYMLPHCGTRGPIQRTEDGERYEILISDVSDRVEYYFEVRTVGYDGQISNMALNGSMSIYSSETFYEYGAWPMFWALLGGTIIINLISLTCFLKTPRVLKTEFYEDSAMQVYAAKLAEEILELAAQLEEQKNEIDEEFIDDVFIEGEYHVNES